MLRQYIKEKFPVERSLQSFKIWQIFSKFRRLLDFIQDFLSGELFEFRHFDYFDFFVGEAL